MIKLFISLFFLLVIVRSQDFNQAEIEDLKRPEFSFKEFTISISKYFLQGPNIQDASTCFRLSDTNKENCLGSCLGTFNFFCGNTLVRQISGICAVEDETSTNFIITSSDEACFREPRKFLNLRNNLGVDLVVFEINDVFPNEDSGEVIVRNKSSWAQVSTKKLCHPQMGERCTSTCIAPSPRHRCDFKTGELLCRSGYRGRNCEIGPNACRPSPCLNGAGCNVAIDEAAICDCPEGTYGRFCENTVCNYANCIHGTCETFTKCQCKEGFTGNRCDQKVCTSSTCSNEGVCRTKGRSTFCECNGKTTLGQKCEETCPDCGANGKCVKKEETTLCLCPFGFEGTKCDTTIRQPPCFDKFCANNGACVTLPGNAKYCNCTEGWKGKTCDEKVCNAENCYGGICSVSGKCICKKTYAGANCESRICNQDDLCKNGGTCKETENSIRCVCPRNYAGNECQFRCFHFCTENGQCVVRDGQTICQCAPGFGGDACEIKLDTIKCDKINCQHGGQCVLLGSNYGCACTSEWQGRDCSVSKCRNVACNNGNCLNGHGCICTRGFSGENCNTATCSSEYCNFRGECTVTGTSKSCECVPPFYGKTCEYSCPLGCVNGRCHYEQGNSKCICNPNFYGPTCENFSTFPAQLNLELAILVVIAIISIITLVIVLVSRITFKKQSRDKLFIQGTIQEAFETKKKPVDDTTLKWDSLM